jgi:hypothetical protein
MNPVGALRQWRDELACGARTRYTCDALWRAACHEAMADDFAKLGLRHVADDLRRKAAEIIVAAAKAQAANE